MTELLKGKRFPEQLFLFAAFAFAIGLITSKVILSISSMLLLLAVLWKGNFNSFKDKILQNKLVLPLLAYLAMHVVALIWTSDYSYALHDLKTKLTLLIVPLVFCLYPLKRTHTEHILTLFVLGIASTSVINFLSWYQFFGHRPNYDIRELSLFGSHIRYGILVAMAAAICLMRMKQVNLLHQSVLMLLFTWFCYYTYFSQILSGMLALLTAIFALFFFVIYQNRRLLAYTSLFIVIAVAILTFFFALYWSEPNDTSACQSLPKRTIIHKVHTNPLASDQLNIGKTSPDNLREEELRRAWNKASKIPYDGKDLKGQPLRFTLMRFISDLGMPKDSVGFSQLNTNDVLLIERGIASREEGKGGLKARWKGIRFELQNRLDPNGHSLLQRMEYWKTAWHIIQANWMFGVGTGDVQQAFDRQYGLDKSPLQKEYRLRAHNTYLTSWLSFGVLGIVAFLWMIVNFLKTGLYLTSPLPFVFMMVAVSTFFPEDTLETQMGTSFFAFFYGLACCENNYNSGRFTEDS